VIGSTFKAWWGTFVVVELLGRTARCLILSSIDLAEVGRIMELDASRLELDEGSGAVVVLGDGSLPPPAVA